MTADELIKSGDVDGALAALKEAVRNAPDNAKLRVFLFQLLCVQSDWPRAVQQLKTCATLDASATPMAQMYREAIICEVFPEKGFAGEKAPLIFGEPDDWMARLVEALSLQASGDLVAANDLRAQAFDAAPAQPGTLNGAPFQWLADADPRLGPVLELILNGKYYWVPFSAISTLTMAAPADLRDAVWTPVNIIWANGGEAVGLVPTRYVGAETAPHLLSRATDWQMQGDTVTAGLGQRMFATDADDFALMDIREIQMTQGDANG